MIAEHPQMQKTDQTAQQMADPRPGDVFTEMYAFTVQVLARKGNRITVSENGKERVFHSAAEFQQAYRYENSDKYWVRFIKNMLVQEGANT